MKTKGHRVYPKWLRILIARGKLKDMDADLVVAVLSRRDPTLIKNGEAYIRTAARRAAAATHRKAARDVTRGSVSLDQEALADNLSHFGTELDIDSLIVQSDYERALSEVPAEYQEAFRLHQEGSTYKEISTELKLPLWTVKKQISKALKKMREELSDWQRPGTMLILAMVAMAVPSILQEAIPDYLTRAGTISTAVGQHHCLNLPDLSRVCVNTNTTLRFDFNPRARSIELLSGEAYFVVHNDTRPFEVRSGSVVVHDLSTGFAALRKDTSTIVTVVKGTVAIVTPHNSWHTAPQFRRLEQVEFDEASQTLHRRPTLSPEKLSRLLAWQDGRIELADTSLEEALEAVSRYHPGLKFKCPTSLRKLKIDASIDVDVDNLDGLLDALHNEYGIHYSKAQVQGQTVISLSRP